MAGGPLETFAHALRRAVDADPRWVAAAAGFELLSFAGYVALLWLVAGRATSRMGIRESVEVTLGGAAATRLMPTGGVGGAALTLWALRRTGLGARAAGRTLLTFPAKWSCYVPVARSVTYWSLWYQEYPVLLSPVWTQPAFPLDFDIASLDNAIATLELMRPVLPANLLGTPAAVVPAGMAEGLPVGVQVMGGKYTELRCLAVAEAIEQRLGTLTPIDPVTG